MKPERLPEPINSIKAENIELAFFYPEGEKEEIFRGTGFELKEAEIHFIGGFSGIGKSLWLKLLAGHLEA